VTFYHKAPTETDWVSCGATCSFTSDLPDGPMRFSAAVRDNTGSSAGHLTMKIFSFELQR
jgi:hypothetical protein